jgi:hypothetical protein
VRRGAPSCRAVLGSCPVAAAVRPRRRCRRRGAVLGGRALPGAVTRARSGRPAGGRRSRGCPDAGQAGRCLSASSGPPWGRPSNRSSGRPASTRPASTRLVSRRPVHPGVRTDRPPVSAALPPRCPPLDLEGLGVAGRPRSGPTGRRAPRGPRAAWSPACIGPDQKGRERRWPCLARTRVDPSPGPPLGRRPGCGAAWPTRALVQGQGAGRVAGEHGRAAAHRPRRASWAGRRVCPTMGLDQEVVTTLCGRWARVVRWRPAPEGSLGSVGEQPAAAPRPRRGRSAVRAVLTGP